MSPMVQELAAAVGFDDAEAFDSVAVHHQSHA
jgi:hypothetical protein